jgi:hypothetical protein
MGAVVVCWRLKFNGFFVVLFRGCVALVIHIRSEMFAPSSVAQYVQDRGYGQIDSKQACHHSHRIIEENHNQTRLEEEPRRNEKERGKELNHPRGFLAEVVMSDYWDGFICGNCHTGN